MTDAQHPLIVGVDPSVRHTAAVAYHPDMGTVAQAFDVPDAPRGVPLEPGRTFAIAQAVADWLVPMVDGETILLAIEDHGGQRGHGAANIALHWRIREELASGDRPVQSLVIAPATLKKFSCGAGNAEKGTVAAAIMRTWGDELPEPDRATEHLLDALALAMLGRLWWGLRDRAALAGIPGATAGRIAVAEWQRKDVARQAQEDSASVRWARAELGAR